MAPVGNGRGRAIVFSNRYHIVDYDPAVVAASKNLIDIATPKAAHILKSSARVSVHKASKLELQPPID